MRYSLEKADCSYGGADVHESLPTALSIIGKQIAVAVKLWKSCESSVCWCDVVLKTFSVAGRMMMAEYIIFWKRISDSRAHCSQATYPRVLSQHLSSPCWLVKSSHQQI